MKSVSWNNNNSNFCLWPLQMRNHIQTGVKLASLYAIIVTVSQISSKKNYCKLFLCSAKFTRWQHKYT